MSNLLALGLAMALTGTFPSGNQMPELEKIASRSVLNEGNTARLEHVFERALKGEPISIVVIGGSITEGAHAGKTELRWGNQVANWWKVTFPNAKIDYHNAGVGATGSDIGVHRLARQVLSHKPDVIGIEFSVNDGNGPWATECMEGIVRQLLRQPNQPAVFLLSMMNQSGGNVQDRHLPVSKHYGLPHISYRDALFPEMKSKTIVWQDLSPDTIHPNAIGHTYAAALVNHYLDAKLTAFKAAKRPAGAVPAIPAPLVGTAFDNTRWISMPEAKIIENKGFTAASDSRWKETLRGHNVGDKLSIEVEGTSIGIIYRRCDQPMGHARVLVDGKEIVKLEAWFNQTWWYTPYQQLIRNQPGKHIVTVEILEEKNPGSQGHEFEVSAITIAE